MDITLNIHQAFYPGASELDNALALRALLDCMVNLNLAYLRYHSAPPLYESGVVYGRTDIWEPTKSLYLPNKHSHQRGRTLFWDPIGTSGGKQRGDCKSLSSALIAEYLMKGKKAEPVFRWVKRKDHSGLLDFHILVKTGLNTFEDPSAKLGMGKDELKWFGL